MEKSENWFFFLFIRLPIVHVNFKNKKIIEKCWKKKNQHRFSVATFFQYIARFARVRIEDSGRNRFAFNSMQNNCLIHYFGLHVNTHINYFSENILLATSLRTLLQAFHRLLPVCGMNPPRRMVIRYHWLAFLNQVRKKSRLRYECRIQKKIDRISTTKYCKIVKFSAKSVSKHCTSFGTKKNLKIQWNLNDHIWKN